MTPIRALEREDLPAVASLYEQVIRSGTTTAAAGLERYFERTLFDHPLVDQELPALVYDDPREGLVAFIASYPRPFAFGDRRVRVACTGQLVARPDMRARGVGALLLRKYMAGPHDLWITDGATDTVRMMAERLGGVTNAAASIGWTHVLSPTSWVAGMLAARRNGTANMPGPAPAARVLGAIDRTAYSSWRRGRPAAEVVSEPLAPEVLVAEMEQVRRTFPLRPAYDAAQLAWLFDQMAAVTGRGPLVRRLVRRPDGRIAGWFVAYMPAHGVTQVMQVGGQGDDLGAVLDELIRVAAEHGAVAVAGRSDPYLHPHLVRLRCILRPTGWALARSDDAELLAAVGFGRALLTRMDGEWWMGHHVLSGEQLSALA